MFQDPANTKVQEAYKNLTEGRLSECFSLCNEILAAQSGHADAIFMLAIVTFKCGNDVEMKAHMEYLLKQVHVNKGQYHNFLGEYHLLCNQLELAAEQFKLAAKTPPKVLDAHRYLGQVLREQGDFDGAMNHLQTYLKARNNDVTAQTELGWVKLDIDRPDEAMEYFQKALSVNEKLAKAVFGLGCAKLKLGQLEPAIQHLKQAIELAPNDPEPCKILGDALYQDGRLDEAILIQSEYLERKNNLTTLAYRFRTDKWGGHFYTPNYQRHFSKRRLENLNILEIGVGGYGHPQRGGASLRMWKQYFPNSKIYSIDIYEKSALQEDRIKIFQGSQNDPVFLKQVASEIGRLDIVLDDGSHVNEHILTSFKTLFPLLDMAGIYVIEDTQTAYWPEYGGSSEDMNHHGSALAYFKSLTDGLNHAEFLIPDLQPDYFQRHIVSMSFYHNMVFIQKGLNDEPSNMVINGEMKG